MEGDKLLTDGWEKEVWKLHPEEFGFPLPSKGVIGVRV